MIEASYDALAGWYGGWASWPPALFDYARHLLPERMVGQDILDVACGQGRLSRRLGAAGANVLGVDVSLEMIKNAEKSSHESPGRIAYRHADIADLDAWWDGTSFDGATCEMALMDIADLDAALRAIATVLRPGGWFAASLVHPCFPGGGIGLPSWPPDGGYSREGFWRSPDHNPEGIRVRIGSHHRTLSTYLNTLVCVGLQIEAIAEPPEPLPQYLAIACRRDSSRPG